MPKTTKYKIYLPNNKTIWICGKTISEAFINGWEKYGKETMKEEPCITVKEFIETVYIPTFFPTLKPKTRDNYESYLRLNIEVVNFS